ncbi:MAG: hypothetical protein WC438_03750 [Candidatus Pacearchaeota archaeon]
MSSHEYISGQYFAQAFRDFIIHDKGAFRVLGGGGVNPDKVRHSGKTLSFPYLNLDHRLFFEDSIGDKQIVTHEIHYSENGNECEEDYSLNLDIQRTRTGRASENYSKNVLELFVGDMKKFHRKHLNSK